MKLVTVAALTRNLFAPVVFLDDLVEHAVGLFDAREADVEVTDPQRARHRLVPSRDPMHQAGAEPPFPCRVTPGGRCDILLRMHRRTSFASLVLVALFAALLPALGCSNTLETGYKPRKLGASTTERRSYYASPFTPEARAAQLDREKELEKRRPTPGY